MHSDFIAVLNKLGMLIPGNC